MGNPSALHHNKMSTSSLPLFCAAKIAVPKVELLYKSNLSCSLPKSMHSQKLVCFKGNSRSKQWGHVAVKCGAKDQESPGDDPSALETVLKLYEAIKNKNVSELSDIIAEECCCISNFVSVFQPFHGKQQVLAFFSSLMKSLGNNIEFVVQQTFDDGMVIAVSWKLEWNKAPLPLGKGFSFYMCHVYQGKMMIKNVEIFIEPLLHIEPLRLKVINSVMNVTEKLNPQALLKNKATRALTILFLLLFAAAVLILLKYRVTTS